MTQDTCRLGVRVDVDTFRGTRNGVPALLDAFAARRLKATFFFTVGPDNMGRHVRRLLRPAFLIKMLRSRASSLYGWDIILRGTLWPGPRIGRRLARVIQDTARAGHEIGLHAWDHYLWQTRIDRLTPAEIREQLQLGIDELMAITGERPRCSAAAGWQCNDIALLEKEALGFNYNSDCRGRSIFRPVAGSRTCAPQIPVTLPTYDELIGRNGVTDDNYNAFLLNLVIPNQLNVLTIHAEVEGCSRSVLFADFLDRASARGIQCVPLRELLGPGQEFATDHIVAAAIPGREGPACWQASAAA